MRVRDTRGFVRGVVVVGFFAAMMTMLIRDHLLPRLRGGDGLEVGNAILADQWFGKDEWMRLSFNGEPIGAMRTQSFNTDDGYASTMKAVIKTGPFEGEVTTASTMDERLNLKAVSATVDFSRRGIARLDLLGMVEGRTMYLKVTTPTGVKHLQVPLKGPITMNTSIDALLFGNQMVPGDVYIVRAFDPILGTEAREIQLKVTGRDFIMTEKRRRQLARVEARMGDAIMRIWVDENGDQARREISLASLEQPATVDQEGEERPTGPRLVMQEMLIANGTREFPALNEEIPLPEVKLADVQGTDAGEPLRAFGFLPLLLGQKLGPFAAPTATNKTND